MDFNSLKYIIATDKYQSITKASEELFITQPNISKAIQNIEKEIGFQIFIRTSRGVITTPEGKSFIKKATKILKSIDDFSKEFSQNNIKPFDLNISFPLNVYFESKFLEFTNQLNNISNININIYEISNDEIIDSLLKDKINVGILCINENDLAYYKRLMSLNNLSYTIKSSHIVKIITSSKNPLSKSSIINKDILKNQTIIISNINDFYHYYEERHQIYPSNSIIKTQGGINQLAILSKKSDSFILSLPVSEETLAFYDLRMLDFDYTAGEWVIVVVYKKHHTLRNIENNFIDTL